LKILSQPRKTSRRRRIGKILFITMVVLLALPLALLHLVTFGMLRHDDAMKPFETNHVTDAYGHKLRYYELQQSNAEWTIIFIHGTPGDGAAFREQFVNPFPHANVITYDRPGFGGSKPALRRPTLEDQANAISALLPTNKTQRTILVGHSYGGPIALQAALKFTNEVAGVLLIGGSIDPAQEKIYSIQRIGDWPVFSWLLPRAIRQCNRELITLKGDLIKLQPRLATLTVPVVMLHGKKDDLVPVENTDYLRRQLAAAGKTNLFDQIIYPDFNHFIPWEHPDAVEAALRKLTDRVHASSQAP
jgi:pimeloyl-ACP methyl ester carboxylesterase